MKPPSHPLHFTPQRTILRRSFAYALLIMLCLGFGRITAQQPPPHAPHSQSPAENQVKLLAEAQTLDRRVGELYGAGKFDEAIHLAQRALAIREKALGPEHPDTATSLSSLGGLYLTTGRYAEAEPLFLRALAISEKIFGPQHPNTAVSLNNLARLYRHRGRQTEAELLLKRALAITEQALGAEHPNIAVCLNDLATVYLAVGRYAEAEPLHKRALEIAEKAMGPEHPNTAISLNDLATLYQATGRYAEAEPLLKRALAITEKILGPEHPNTAGSLYNLAVLFQETGRYTEAETLLARGHEILEKALGLEHPDIAMSINLRASLYKSAGRSVEAAPLLKRALEISEKALGPEHPNTAHSLNSLACIYESTGRYVEAEPLFVRALAIQERFLDPEHPGTAPILNNLATLYRKTGRYAEAEPLYKRSLEVLEKTVGPNHPDTSVCLGNLAFLYDAAGHSSKAMDFATKFSRIESFNLRRMLNYFSETECLAYVAHRQFLYDLAGMLDSGSLAASALLGRKALIMDSIGLRRRLEADLASDPPGLAFLRQRERLAPGYQKLLLEQGEAAQPTQALKKQIDDLDKQINLRLQGSSGGSLTLVPPAVELTGLQRALPQGTRLLEGFRYRHWVKDKKASETRYAWTVIGPAASGEPILVSLGAAQPIEDAIAEFCHWARPVVPGRGEDSRLALSEAERDTKLQAAAERLHQLLWHPLLEAKALPPEVSTVVLSADAQQHFVPFALLSKEPGHFLGHDYHLRYVNSARDLVPSPPAPPDGPRKALLVGDPLYDQEGASPNPSTEPFMLAMSLRGGMVGDTRSLPPFGRLHGTAIEVGSLKRLLQSAGFQTGSLLQAEATEPTFVAHLKHPTILHLATHGFFLAAPEEEPPAPSEGFEHPGGPRGKSALHRVQNPMYRSGLALCGAENTRKAWEEETIPDPKTDGILLAAEAAALDLRGTELVVLSACSTGEGKALDGEGVMGLRRALAVAGAQTVVMSLWPVEDTAAVEFMSAFYRKYLDHTHPAQALQRTQMELLTQGIELYGLQGAIARYGPFLATSLGPVAAAPSAPQSQEKTQSSSPSAPTAPAKTTDAATHERTPPIPTAADPVPPSTWGRELGRKVREFFHRGP